MARQPKLMICPVSQHSHTVLHLCVTVFICLLVSAYFCFKFLRLEFTREELMQNPMMYTYRSVGWVSEVYVRVYMCVVVFAP